MAVVLDEDRIGDRIHDRGQARVFWETDELVLAEGGVNVNDEILTDAAGVDHSIPFSGGQIVRLLKP